MNRWIGAGLLAAAVAGVGVFGVSHESARAEDKKDEKMSDMKGKAEALTTKDISLEQAHAVLAAAAKKAAEIDTKMDIAVVDAGGNLKAFARMDGARPASATTAMTKAVTAATLAGKWNVNIDNPSGAMQVFLELKNDPKDAKKVTGTISSQMGDANLEGEVVDGKLSFHFTMNANGSDIAVSFAGTQQKDGSLAGTLEYGQGPVNWTGTREKKN